MPKIIQLESHVADLIAAGEVVERPASVVKELIENSIDAGAGIITVEAAAGGMTYLRVTDDGCGIAPKDAETAFLRHATSKLSGADGLEAIGTLGFRGEALAAIAAVSRIEMLTRERGSQEGVSLSISGGVVNNVAPTGCPEGTTIIVRDLFFNTPARLKFMKSDRAEASAISSVVLRAALSRPDVSIRFIRDGKTEYHTPGDSRVDSVIYSLFGREFSMGLLPAESSDETVNVTGFVSAPSAARGNRNYQFFFVNGRPIKSKTLQAALEQAFSNKLPSGKYPSCVLYISTRFSDVDVNVHPAKTEIKFVSDKQVFDGIYYAALGALSNNTPPHESHTPAGADTICPHGSHTPAGADTTRPHKSHTPVGADTIRPHPTPPHGSGINALSNNTPVGATVPGRPHGSYTPVGADTIRPHGSPPTTLPIYEPNESLYQTSPKDDYRTIGETLGTYIVVDCGDKVVFIDKHAAHERIHFNALKSDNFEPMAQHLIEPEVCRLGVETATLVLENAKLLNSLGFSVESFGDESIAVRQIPSEIEIEDTETVLSDICSNLKLGGPANRTNLDAIFRSIACKAAIKAGKSSAPDELKILVKKVMSGEITECPHGRPLSFELTKTTLDKKFGRA